MTIIPLAAEESDPSVRLLFRPLLAVDIQGYSARTARMQLQAQSDLLEAMERAAKDADLDRGRWLQQVSGDGELAVLPGDADIVTVVARFAPALERALAQRRKVTAAGPRLRVRLALHHGALIMGPPASFGPAGDAPVVVSRLRDARPLRQYLTVHPERNFSTIARPGVSGAASPVSFHARACHFRLRGIARMEGRAPWGARPIRRDSPAALAEGAFATGMAAHEIMLDQSDDSVNRLLRPSHGMIRRCRGRAVKMRIDFRAPINARFSQTKAAARVG